MFHNTDFLFFNSINKRTDIPKKDKQEKERKTIYQVRRLGGLSKGTSIPLFMLSNQKL